MTSPKKKCQLLTFALPCSGSRSTHLGCGQCLLQGYLFLRGQCAQQKNGRSPLSRSPAAEADHLDGEAREKSTRDPEGCVRKKREQSRNLRPTLTTGRWLFCAVPMSTVNICQSAGKAIRLHHQGAIHAFCEKTPRQGRDRLQGRPRCTAARTSTRPALEHSRLGASRCNRSRPRRTRSSGLHFDTSSPAKRCRCCRRDPWP